MINLDLCAGVRAKRSLRSRIVPIYHDIEDAADTGRSRISTRRRKDVEYLKIVILRWKSWRRAARVSALARSRRSNATRTRIPMKRSLTRRAGNLAVLRLERTVQDRFDVRTAARLPAIANLAWKNHYYRGVRDTGYENAEDRLETEHRSVAQNCAARPGRTIIVRSADCWATPKERSVDNGLTVESGRLRDLRDTRSQFRGPRCIRLSIVLQFPRALRKIHRCGTRVYSCTLYRCVVARARAKSNLSRNPV